MKVVITNTQSLVKTDQALLDDLGAEFPSVTFLAAETQEDEKRLIRDADVFVGWPARPVAQAAERLRWIHVPGTGVDKLGQSLPELPDSDTVVTNCRGPHAPPMADHVMGMVINLAHRWRELFEDQRTHNWDMAKYNNRYVELRGSTMGILALGDIGTEVARRAHGFGMKVYAVDLRPKSPPPEVEEMWGLARLDDLLEMSDWFVVTAPLTEVSEGMIDRRRVGLLKDGAFVIIISRGHIVDEDALADELRSGRLGGAGIDAFAKEPLREDSPLWDMDNVVITPHASALTPEMWVGRRAIFRENLRRFLANEPFLYTVDKKAGF